MKSAAILLALAAGASAFTTSSQPAASRSVAVNAVIDEWDGAYDLRGKEFKFDPVRSFYSSKERKNEWMD